MNHVFSKITSKSQTVIPKEVRDRLGIKPGDRVRYSMSANGVLLERVDPAVEGDPFAVFSEWSGAADEKAFSDL